MIQFSVTSAQLKKVQNGLSSCVTRIFYWPWLSLIVAVYYVVFSISIYIYMVIVFIVMYVIFGLLIMYCMLSLCAFNILIFQYLYLNQDQTYLKLL